MRHEHKTSHHITSNHNKTSERSKTLSVHLLSAGTWAATAQPASALPRLCTFLWQQSKFSATLRIWPNEFPQAKACLDRASLSLPFFVCCVLSSLSLRFSLPAGCSCCMTLFFFLFLFLENAHKVLHMLRVSPPSSTLVSSVTHLWLLTSVFEAELIFGFISFILS